MSVPNSGRARNPADDRSAREAEAISATRRIVVTHAQLQASLGGALRVMQLLPDAVRGKRSPEQLLRAAAIITRRLEAIGASASHLARDVVRLQDIIHPPVATHWREILRDAQSK